MHRVVRIIVIHLRIIVFCIPILVYCFNTIILCFVTHIFVRLLMYRRVNAMKKRCHLSLLLSFSVLFSCALSPCTWAEESMPADGLTAAQPVIEEAAVPVPEAVPVDQPAETPPASSEPATVPVEQPTETSPTSPEPVAVPTEQPNAEPSVTPEPATAPLSEPARWHRYLNQQRNLWWRLWINQMRSRRGLQIPLLR